MKFYTFNQNNSGGSFDIDDDIAHYVIIEAANANEANNKAKSIGIYFDGVDKDIDCPCCGDRWSPNWADDGSDEPEIYGEEITSDFYDMFTPIGKPVCHIYYADGNKKTFYCIPKEK